MTGLFDNCKISQQEVRELEVIGKPNVLVGTTYDNQKVFDDLPLRIVEKFNVLADAASEAIQNTDNTRALTNEEIERILND